MERYFRQYGEVADVAIMRDKHSNKSRGFAFVTFRERTRQGVEALHKMLLQPVRPHILLGRDIEIRVSDGSKPPDSFLDKNRSRQNSRS